MNWHIPLEILGAVSAIVALVETGYRYIKKFSATNFLGKTPHYFGQKKPNRQDISRSPQEISFKKKTSALIRIVTVWNGIVKKTLECPVNRTRCWLSRTAHFSFLLSKTSF